MARLSTHSRDLILATLLGVLAESILVLVLYFGGVDLYNHHPWVEISQMPGAQIAERMFRHSGRPQALALAFFVQAVIFGSLITTLTCVFRLVKERRR